MRNLAINECDFVGGGDLAANVTATTAVTIGSGLGAVAGTLVGGPVGAAIGAGVGAGVGTAVAEYSHDLVNTVSDAVLNNSDIRKGMVVTDWVLKSVFNI